jgi:hypothetical protein
VEHLKGMFGGILATVIGGLILLAIIRPFSSKGESTPGVQEETTEEEPETEYTPFSFYSPKLRFYASGEDIPDLDKRRYQTRFAKDSLAYLNWELNLSYGKAKKRMPFSVMAVYYHANGDEFARQTLETYADKDWENSYHNWGWGWDKPGEWPKDTFTVELYIRGNMVKKGAFVVY